MLTNPQDCPLSEYEKGHVLDDAMVRGILERGGTQIIRRGSHADRALHESITTFTGLSDVYDEAPHILALDTLEAQAALCCPSTWGERSKKAATLLAMANIVLHHHSTKPPTTSGFVRLSIPFESKWGPICPQPDIFEDYMLSIARGDDQDVWAVIRKYGTGIRDTPPRTLQSKPLAPVEEKGKRDEKEDEGLDDDDYEYGGEYFEPTVYNYA